MVGQNGEEVTKHSAAMLPPKSDKNNTPKKLFIGSSKAAESGEEIRIPSKRPKTLGGFTRPRTMGGFTGPRTMGGFTGPRTMGGFTKHGGGSKFFDLNELDASHGQMAGVDEQYVDQAAVKAGSTPTRSFKRKVESESLVPGLFGGGYYEKPDVPLAADEYDDQGNGRSPVKGNIFFGNSSFSAPSNSEQAGRVSFRASTPSEQREYDSLKASVKALKAESTLLSDQIRAEAEVSGLIAEENTMLLRKMRLKWPPKVVAKLEAENPSR